MQVAEARLLDEHAEIAYVKGESFEAFLDELLEKGQYEECFKQMEAFLHAVCRNRKKGFSPSEEFAACFGSVAQQPNWEVVPLVDIDSLFGNVIYQDGKWVLYDCEWMLDFDVPVKFFIFRTLHYYLTAARWALVEKGIYGHFAISLEERKLFEGMEERFQKSIEGRYISLWRLYQEIHGKIVDGKSLCGNYLNNHQIQVYFDDGNGFSEEHSQKMHLDSAENNRYKMELAIPEGINTVRIDPANSACILEVKAFTNETGQEVSYTTNGELLAEGTYFFHHDDPQLVVECANSQNICFSFVLGVMAFDNAQMKERFDEEQEKLWRDREVLVAEKRVLEDEKRRLIEEKRVLEDEKRVLFEETCALGDAGHALRLEIERMQNTKVWKVYRKIKKQ